MRVKSQVFVIGESKVAVIVKARFSHHRLQGLCSLCIGGCGQRLLLLRAELTLGSRRSIVRC